MRRRIGECLVHAGLITDHDLREALVEQKHTREHIGVILVRRNLASDKQIANALALQLGLPFVSLVDNRPDPGILALVPRDLALEHACAAIGLEQNVLTLAMADPLLFGFVQELESQTGYRVRQVVATHREIVELIETAYPVETIKRKTNVASASEAVSVDEAIDSIMRVASVNGAEEIHIDPTETDTLVRQRRDGMLEEVTRLPEAIHAELVARLKALAGMDVVEERLPQDGRHLNLRVSTWRTAFGEKVAMRPIDDGHPPPALEDSGLSPFAFETLMGLLRSPHGLILVAGPIGNGRTTTMRSAFASIARERTNAVVFQGDVSVAGDLRAVPDRDPDVLLSGEIRDAETATRLLQAARKGPLVLAMLHADAAASAVSRLLDMEIGPDLVAGALVGVVAQRLVRRLCVRCRRPSAAPAGALQALGLLGRGAEGAAIYQAVGCDQCAYTGYRGRIGVFEVMQIGEALRLHISSRSEVRILRDAAIADGMVTLGEDGLAKVVSGMTTPEELCRVLTEPGECRTLCSGCGGVVTEGFGACPRCGQRREAACPRCGRALQSEWSFCPFCARSGPAETLLRRLP